VAFDFPASPAEGQVFTPPSGPTYVFNTPVWKAVGQGQIAIISDTPPSNPANGALWYESDSGVLYIWYNDGNSSQWVQVGGIQAGAPVPPAADNAEYVMVNGAWRLKSQSFDLAGLTQQDVAVPSWLPSTARFTGYAFHGGLAAMLMQVSSNGTTFPAAATDYNMVGWIFYTGSTGAYKQPLVASGAWTVTNSSDNVTLPHSLDVVVFLNRNTGNNFTYQLRSYSYNNSTLNLETISMVQGYTTAANFPGTGPIKALRLLTGGSPVSGKLTVEWLA
jgi:hypothetical protein